MEFRGEGDTEPQAWVDLYWNIDDFRRRVGSELGELASQAIDKAKSSPK